MTTPDCDRASDRSLNDDSRSAEPSGSRSAPTLMAVSPRESVASGVEKTPSRRGRPTRQPQTLRSRIRFQPQVGLLEQRALLSADVIYKNTTNTHPELFSCSEGGKKVGGDLAANIDINELSFAARSSAEHQITALNFHCS